MSARTLTCLSIVLLLGSTAGCDSGDDLPREAISGTVSLDSEPLKSGNISFTPAGSSNASAASAVAAPISDGLFEVPASQGLVPGAYSVLVSSVQPGKPRAPAKVRRAAPGVADTVSGAGGDDANENLPETHEAIPSRYNTQTTLKADVAKGGPNKFDFPLKTKS